MGDVKTRLQNAQRLINQHAGPVMRCSHRYKSRAWGFDAEEEFSNQVLEVDTDLTPEQLLDALQAIEREREMICAASFPNPFKITLKGF